MSFDSMDTNSNGEPEIPILTERVDGGVEVIDVPVLNEGTPVRDEQLAARLRGMFEAGNIASARGVLEEGGEDAASLLRQASAVATLTLAGVQANKSA